MDTGASFEQSPEGTDSIAVGGAHGPAQAGVPTLKGWHSGQRCDPFRVKLLTGCFFPGALPPAIELSPCRASSAIGSHALGTLLAATIAFALCLSLASAEASQEKPSYAQNIAPIFQDKCVACHDHATRASGLNLESFETLMNGGRRGPAVVPGKSGESLLVKVLEGSVKPQMPPGDKLSDAEIRAIRAWVDAGAPGPATAPAKEEPKKEGPKAETSGKPGIPEIRPTVPVKAAVSSLAFRPDGAMIALGGYQEVELVNAADRRSGGKLNGHANQVRALAFSPDGRLLAAAGGHPGQFGEVKIWSVAERKEVGSIRSHRDNIFAVAFSPDGKTIATASYDRLVKLWDAATGQEARTLKDHTDAVFGLAFSPDGRRLASASADRTVKIWEVATGRRLYTLSDALDGLNAVAFHPSGKQLAAAGADRSIRIWELGETDGRQIHSLIAHEDAITHVAYSPDGKMLVSTGADKVIKLWDPATLTEVRIFERQPDWVFALAFSPDGKQLAVGRYDGSIAVYDPATGRRVGAK